MKKFSVLLAALLVLLLAGCGEPKEQAETTQEQTAATVSAEEAGFTLEDVLRINGVKNLVSAFGGVQAMRYEGDELISETYYFMYAGKVVSTCKAVNADGDSIYSCTVNNTMYEKNGDRLQFSYDLDAAKQKAKGYAFDDAVTGLLPDGTIRRIEKAGKDLWRVEIGDESSAVVCRCDVTREDLTIKQIEVDYGDGTGVTIKLEHGSDVQTKEFGLLEGFSKDLRKITCVCTLHDKAGKPTETKYEVKAPYNAEPMWTCSRELNVYLDKDLTVPYKYPGDGDGYTVYATDAMG